MNFLYVALFRHYACPFFIDNNPGLRRVKVEGHPDPEIFTSIQDNLYEGKGALFKDPSSISG
jgi:hypothetical protein